MFNMSLIHSSIFFLAIAENWAPYDYKEIATEAAEQLNFTASEELNVLLNIGKNLKFYVAKFQLYKWLVHRTNILISEKRRFYIWPLISKNDIISTV